MLAYKKYFWIFSIIGLLVFSPILFNGFVWDDKGFILQNSEIHQFNLLTLLGPNMFNSGSFYRPIPAIYFSALYSVFGEQAFFYHVMQLMLHILCTFFLFLFFRRFFTNSISFILGLVFLIHPIQVESVAFIGASQSELYFLPGIAALILSMRPDISRNRLISIILLLTLTIFTKETGMLFIPLIFLYRKIYKLELSILFIISTSSLSILYFLVRYFIGGVSLDINQWVPINYLSFTERLFHIPAIIVYYLKTFLLPIDLTIWQIWIIKTVTLQNFYLPLLTSILFFSILSYATRRLFTRSYNNAVTISQIKNKQERKQEYFRITLTLKDANDFLFFFAWLIIGFSIILQIIPLDMTVADRWFYFPIVGILGLIGTASQLVLVKYKLKKQLLIVAIIIICLFSLRTFIRTLDWKDELTLMQHDLGKYEDNFMIIHRLAKELWFAGRQEESLKYFKMGLSIHPDIPSYYDLGYVYVEMKQYPEAITALESAIKISKKLSDRELPPPSSGLATLNTIKLKATFEDLVRIYGSQGRNEDVIKLMKEEAIPRYPTYFMFYYFLGLAEATLKNQDQALVALNKAYELSRDKEILSFINSLKSGSPQPKEIKK